MRYFTANQLIAALLLCVLAAAGWSLRWYSAAGRREEPLPFEAWSADTNALAEVDSIRGRLAAPVDVNTAGPVELRRLNGIGPELSARIIAERERGGPFADADELARRVRGIGPVTVERLRGTVVFSRPEAAGGSER